ncbi:PIN domain-containing protein [Dactylosporangium sp. NPDC000521]|uniref:PIN domain-containing protein n=1 Tax=Dactylosporangium sp. NPDC000521 TaxID=3363975 RepID=UPI0036751871
MRYLVDTSALVRIYRRQAAAPWYDLVARGLILVSEPVLVETLTLAEAHRYLEVESELLAAYPWAGIPDGIWDLVAVIRHELVKPSAFTAVSVADLVIAATAIRLKLVVLHEDGDFETIARHVPELRQQRVSVDPD